MRSFEQLLTGRCPQLAVTRERYRRETEVDGCTCCMAALPRAIVWLQPHQRRAPLRPPPAADRRQALPGNSAGQRRPGPRRLAMPGRRQSRTAIQEPAATAARTAVAAVTESLGTCGLRVPVQRVRLGRSGRASSPAGLALARRAVTAGPGPRPGGRAT